MAEVVKMPKMSDTMTEGVIAKWHKKVGDKVSSGDLVAEIETDKATMDFESYQEGTLLYIGPKEGEAVPVNAVIAVLGEEGEDYKALLNEENSQGNNENSVSQSTQDTTQQANKAEEAPKTSSKPQVTAEDLGVTVITMPLLSDTMTEGVISKWNFKVGDNIKSDDAIADVETDKATMEVTAYAEGTLLHIGVNEGEAAKVNGIIAIVGKAGTDITPLLENPAPVATSSSSASNQTSTEEKKEEVKTTPAPTAAAAQSTTLSSDDSRLKASPLAKKIAKDKGIDLSQVKGSAEGGRIVKKDVENFEPSQVSSQESATSSNTVSVPAFMGQESFTEKPVSQMRKTIAKRLSESLFTAPHFYLTIKVDMDSAMEARTKINDVAPTKVSFNDLVIKAVAVALKKHPAVNSSWLGDKIRYNDHVNVGVAVAVEDGLLVPVVRFADGKSLSQISTEVKDFAQRAKTKKLQPSDWEGSTFTVSNLGMFGIDQFTAIINPPDACILAVGGIQQVPVVKNGAVVPGNIMKLTLSCDHRAVDGATGAAFLQTVKSLLEEPIRILA